MKARVENVCEDGSRIVEFIYDGVFETILAELGEMPLPPYIKEKLNDKSRYNTVYSKSRRLLLPRRLPFTFYRGTTEKIKAGVEFVEVLLHVGLGTFRPAKVDDAENHHMHSEFYSVSASAAEAQTRQRQKGGG